DQFKEYFDQVLTVSEHGKKYYSKEYQFDPSKVSVSRLGVLIDGRSSGTTLVNKLSVISISNCYKIKRLHVIAEAIILLVKRNKNLRVKWTHVGDGPTLKEIQETLEK
ncbi:hypothetical protein RZS08_63015, partial [Arthrospira platensis SPKY1]|nr:hypothetical protein [Arthrospira platensis SPKY1]